MAFDARVEEELVHEQRLQRQQDREYWQPLKAELEQLRLNRRKQILTQFFSRLSKKGVGRVALSTTLVALAAASARVSATLADRRFTDAPLQRSLPSTPSASTHDPFQFFNSLLAKLPKATSKGLKKLSGSCRITTACVLGYCHLSQFEEPTFATGLPLIAELV